MPKIAVINNAEPGITEFATPIEEIISEANSSSIIIEYSDCPNYDFSQIDGVILTGSPQGDDIVEHHLPYFKWIKCFDKPLFGICAGHHITAYLYGAKLLRGEEPESGNFKVEIVRQDTLFREMRNTFTVKQMHNDSVTLPHNFELLVTSTTCYNQLMKHKQRPFYTSQFHPEFYNKKLIRNFVKLCK